MMSQTSDSKFSRIFYLAVVFDRFPELGIFFRGVAF